MKSLYELYQEHQGKVSDKWLGYFDAYSHTLSSYRDQSVCLLEIGVQNGGSLEIWGKFFSNAKAIIGCDINTACARLQFDDPRIRVVVGDAAQESTKSQVMNQSKNFDIVIDDGSHTSADIIRAFCQYFPLIKDGGVFIAEDLHCSYWSEFDGGLYHPYSSIAFFKRLADVVNFEHIGVGKSRADLVRGIFQKYDIECDDELFEHIHSIEFINSVCIVRKRASIFNMLGRRIVAGCEEAVVPGHLALADTESQPVTQAENRWSTLASAPEELYESIVNTMQQQAKEIAHNSEELSRLQQRVLLAENQVAVLHKSLSWRITSPLRLAARPVLGAVGWTKSIRAIIDRNGGVRESTKLAMSVLQHRGLEGLLQTIKTAVAHTPSIGMSGNHGFDRNNYTEWVRRYDTLTDADRQRMRDVQAAFAVQPLISVVMPTYNPKPEWLIEAIESVRGQIYPHWELCIADDASTDPAIRPILERYAMQDERIKVVFRLKNGHISAASNSAIELATGEWIALLDHDDLLSENALFWVAETINRAPDARLIYSDEDKISENGRRSDPYFKCEWNPDLFYSHNMISHLGVYHASVVKEIGGFRQGFEGSQDYDIALRFIERIDPVQIIHIPRVLYHWRVHAESTAMSGDSKPYAALAGERAINEHFARTGVNGRVKYAGYGYEPAYDLPANLPLVSIIIPTRNGRALLKQCIDSIAEKTSYKNYEILIIDNGSDEADALAYFEKLSKRPNIRVVRDDSPFNYSRLNNKAVELAQGEVIALVNNDIEVISRDWLTVMVAHALRPGVGAVGAKLWYTNKTLQHGGVFLGYGGVAGHSHKHSAEGATGYFGRLLITQSLSAVTAACLVIKKSIFNEVGGLEEEKLRIAFNDIDFCLRVREAGYRNVWTPLAELFHHESASRGLEDTPEKQARFAGEVTYMKERWGAQLLNDPAYSPNLTLDHEDFSYAWPPRIVCHP